ncbi:hypothetical protein [Lewinella sp. JB7]|uniref:DUF7935 family protein n=1 Tax=Lewinella sp. JB7 TaxID=2962887 RepID=UPI0020C9842F|nr:hypothetical protein [Lewinella sp. JB7]MCP9234452.1 hypothetical protein [Lewinella sp. JB7]
MELVTLLLWILPTVLTIALIWALRDALTRFSEAIVRLEERTSGDDGGKAQTDLEGLRLQACERFTLMLERISVPNLLLRIPPDPATAPREYTAELLLSIRQEVEYNITQQIYVSDSLWSIITQSRDNISLLIARAAEGAETSSQIANRLRTMSSRQPEDPVALAQGAIRREASSVLTG